MKRDEWILQINVLLFQSTECVCVWKKEKQSDKMGKDENKSS